MDYEKKYKEALGWIQSLYKGLHGATKKDAEHYFPELKESEDDRIKKAIHIYLDWLDGRKDIEPRGEYSIRDMIAWLEKQGEQKPAWSEEDKKQLERAIYMMEQLNMTKSWDDVYNWLKSLKPQPHWKPTKEQMDELEKFIVWADELYDENSIRTIRSLINDIKKL